MSPDYRAHLDLRLAPAEMGRPPGAGEGPLVTRIDLAGLQAACTGL